MHKVIFRVQRKDIDYIRNTMESYDGIALVKTVDPDKALIEIHIAPKCGSLIDELVYSLKRREKIEIVRL